MIPTARELQKKSCKPCEGGLPPLSVEEARKYLESLEGWILQPDGKSIQKSIAMKDFKAAVEAINRIAEVAEGEGHHPDLHLTGYRKLTVDLSTHSIDGLSENDFILASKIEGLLTPNLLR